MMFVFFQARQSNVYSQGYERVCSTYDCKSDYAIAGEDEKNKNDIQYRRENKTKGNDFFMLTMVDEISSINTADDIKRKEPKNNLG